MKISNILEIKIEDATFTFRKPTLKFLLELQGLNSFDYIAKVLNSLIKIEGLHDENDQPISQSNGVDLPLELVTNIVSKWNEHNFKQNQEQEKKS
jgi:hypothetical protein